MKTLTMGSLLCASVVAPALALQTTPSLISAQSEQEIVVIGTRLRNIRFKLRRDGKTMAGSCRVTRTSGDVMLDTMACEAAVECMGTKKVTVPDFNKCMTPKWRELTNTRAQQLRSARAGR